VWVGCPPARACICIFLSLASLCSLLSAPPAWCVVSPCRAAPHGHVGRMTIMLYATCKYIIYLIYWLCRVMIIPLLLVAQVFNLINGARRN
jgi:hypothetical protein